MSDQHDNFERDLTDKLTHLAESAIPGGDTATNDKVDIVRWHGEPRRRIFDVAAAAAAVIVVVVGFVVVIGQRDDPGAVRTDYPPTTDTLNTSPPTATTNPTLDSDAEEEARKRAEEEVAQAHEDLENRAAEERDRVRAANEQLIAERFAEIGVDYVPLAERRVAYLDPERYGTPSPVKGALLEWVGGAARDYMAVDSDGATITWREAGPGTPEQRGLEPLDTRGVVGSEGLPSEIGFYRTDTERFSSIWVERDAVGLQNLMIVGPAELEHDLEWIVDLADQPIESIVAPEGYQALGRPTVNVLQYSHPSVSVRLAQFDVPLPEGVIPIPAYHTDLEVGDGFVESKDLGARAWRVDDHTLASIVTLGMADEPGMLEELAAMTRIGAAKNTDVGVLTEGFPGTAADGISAGNAELVALVLGNAFGSEHVRFALAVSRNPSTGATCSGFVSTFGGSTNCSANAQRAADEFCASTMINNGDEQVPNRVLVLVDSERADGVAFDGEEVTTRIDRGASGGHDWAMIEATIVGSESASSGLSVDVTVDGELCGSSPESTSTAVGTVAPSPVEPTGPATSAVMTEPPS